MAKNDVSFFELQEALSDADRAITETVNKSRSASGMILGGAGELEEAMRTAMCLSRDLADLAIRIGGAVRRARTEERIKGKVMTK